MHSKNTIRFIINSALLGLLLALGIGLLFMRTEKIPRFSNIDLEIGPLKPEEKIISGQYLVLFSPQHIDKIEEVLKPLNLEVAFPILNWILVAQKNKHDFLPISLTSREAEEDLLVLNSLLQHPAVLDAQHNYALEASSVEPANKNWHLDAHSAMNRGLNLPKAWELSTGSPDITIAVIDDFIQKGMFSFAERFKECTSRVGFLEPFGPPTLSPLMAHGELMLLALGACNNHSPFSSGVDSNARLFAVQRSSSGHAQTMAAALFSAGIDICKQSIAPCPKKLIPVPPKEKANIILLPFANNAPDMLQFLADMMDAINKEKIITVSAAGNKSANASDYFPGNAPGIINVGSSDKDGRRSSFSNWGPAVDVLAPGENIKFNYPNLTKTAAGTSISAAFVAGGISLMKAINPLLSWKDARYYLMNSGASLSCEDYCLEESTDDSLIGCHDLCCATAHCGSFILDLAEALKRAKIGSIANGLLEVDRSYLIFTRSYSQPQKLVIHNIGSTETKVEALLYDNNIVVNPASFSLSPNNSPNDHIIVDISFHKEPFKRQTSKIEFIIKEGSIIADRSEVFIEYIPKT